LKDTFLN